MSKGKHEGIKKQKMFSEMLGEHGRVEEGKKASQRKGVKLHLLRLNEISWTVARLTAREAFSLLVWCLSWVFMLDYLG